MILRCQVVRTLLGLLGILSELFPSISALIGGINLETKFQKAFRDNVIAKK